MSQNYKSFRWNKFHMTAQTAGIVGAGDSVDARSVQNWADRGFVQYEEPKSDYRRKLFSLESAFQIAAIHYLRDAVPAISEAAKLGDVFVQRAKQVVAEDIDLDDESEWMTLWYTCDRWKREDPMRHKLLKLGGSMLVPVADLQAILFKGGFVSCFHPIDYTIRAVLERYREWRPED